MIGKNIIRFRLVLYSSGTQSSSEYREVCRVTRSGEKDIDPQ